MLEIQRLTTQAYGWNNWGQSKIKPNYQSFYQSFCCSVFLAKFILL